MVKIRAFDKAIVDKKILVASCLLRSLWFTHKTIDIHIVRFLFHRNQLGIIRIPKELNDSLFQTSGFKVKYLLPVGRKRKENLGKGKCDPCKLIDNMAHFCGIAL